MESTSEAVSLYLPGQSRILKSPAEMTQDLLVRDVENLANFDGITPAGATIVPKTYVPKNPRVVLPEKGPEASRHCQGDEKHHDPPHHIAGFLVIGDSLGSINHHCCQRQDHQCQSSLLPLLGNHPCQLSPFTHLQ